MKLKHISIFLTLALLWSWSVWHINNERVPGLGLSNHQPLVVSNQLSRLTLAMTSGGNVRPSPAAEGQAILGDERSIQNLFSADPLLASQPVRFTGSDGAPFDWFGYSVSVSGNTLVVGAHQAAVGGNWKQGTAYVFSRNQGGSDAWGKVTKLTASDGAADDVFGYDVSVNGDALVIGAHGAAVNSHGARGAAYVFYSNQNGSDAWDQVAKLSAADGTALDRFGWSVSISGDTAVIGAPYADISSQNAQGAAYVFSRDQGGIDAWGQVARLTASDGAADDWFGSSVSVSGDTLIVGAHGAAVIGSDDQGAVYVFERDQGGSGAWGQVAKLTAADGAALDWFGWSVSISGETALVGAPYAAADGNSAQGAAYVFSRDQGGARGWGQVAKLAAADGAAYDFLGISTAISGGVAVVGAHGAAFEGRDWQGAAYAFYRNQDGVDAWGQVARLTAPDGAGRDRFGWSTSISGDIVAFGAPHADSGGNVAQGMTYLFTRNQNGAHAWSTLSNAR